MGLIWINTELEDLNAKAKRSSDAKRVSPQSQPAKSKKLRWLNWFIVVAVAGFSLVS